MRTLLYVPTVHTPEESGGGNPAYRNTLTRVLGSAEVTDMDATAREYWRNALRQMVLWIARERIEPWLLDVYVDGLPDVRRPNGGRARYRVVPADQFEHPTRHIVWVLHKNGATVHGTEDPGLIRECSARMDADGYVWRDVNDPRGLWLMNARDPYIARTIHETLPDGHWGILFIGSAHRADDELRKLDPFLRIIYVCENPLTGKPATPLF